MSSRKSSRTSDRKNTSIISKIIETLFFKNRGHLPKSRGRSAAQSPDARPSLRSIIRGLRRRKNISATSIPGSLLLAAALLVGANANAVDWDYGIIPIVDGTYENIINFNSGDSLYINTGGWNSIFDGFGIRDVDGESVPLDSILNVELFGTNPIRSIYFSNDAPAGFEWTVQAGGSFTTYGIGFQIGENGTTGPDDNGTDGMAGTFTAEAGSITNIGGWFQLGGDGGNGGGGIGGIGGDGGGGGGTLNIGGGIMNFEGYVSIGGDGGAGGVGVAGDGGDGLLTVSKGTVTFGGTVDIGGDAFLFGGGTVGTGTVKLSDGGTIIMTGGNTMTLRGAAGKFTMDGGTFQTGLTSGVGATISAAAFDIHGGTLVFDLTGAIKFGELNETTNLTLTGTAPVSIASSTIDVLRLQGDGTYNLVTNVVPSATPTPTLHGKTVDPKSRISVFELLWSGNTLQLKVDGGTNHVVTWTGEAEKVGDKNWDTESANWSNKVNADERFLHGDIVNFDGNEWGLDSDTIDSDIYDSVLVAGLYFSDDSNYAFHGYGIEADETTSTLTGAAANGKLVLGKTAYFDEMDDDAKIVDAPFTGTVDLTRTEKNVFKDGIELHGGTLRVLTLDQIGTDFSKLEFLGTVSTNVPTLRIASGGDIIVDGDDTGEQRIVVQNGLYGAIALEKNTTLTFQNNQSGTVGGAIENNGVFTFTGDTGTKLTFSGNEADSNGGAFYSASSLDLTSIERVTFEKNHAIFSDGSGGGIYLMDENPTLDFADGVIFNGNTATFSGGAIYVFSGGGDIRVTFGAGAELTNNQAHHNIGGAIAADFDFDSAVKLGEDAYVSNNRAGVSGGAFHSSFLDIGTGATIENNRAFNGDGGAGKIRYALNLQGDTTVTNNYAKGYGGAFYIEGDVDDEGNPYESYLMADGGDIVFTGNLHLVMTFDAFGDPLDGSSNALYLNENVALVLDGENNIYFDDPINSSAVGSGNISLTKVGTGFVQFATHNSYLNATGKDGGAVDVYDGSFRVVDGAVFNTFGEDSDDDDDNDAVFWVGEDGEIAGGRATLAGTGSKIHADKGFSINGTISPDSAVLTPTNDHNELLTEGATRFGVLELSTNTDSQIELDGFTYVYDIDPDVAASNASNANAVTGDLLLLSRVDIGGTGIAPGATLANGTVELRGTLTDGGFYHLIKAEDIVVGGIGIGTAADLNEVLTATQGGLAVEPRWQTDFMWGGVDNDDTKNVWLRTARNTLTMNWVPGSVAWGATDAWKSEQSTGSGATENFSTTFYAGDYVKFAPGTGVDQEVTIVDGGVKVSGFEFGGEGTIIFTGGGIALVGIGDPDVKGEYVAPNTGTPQVEPSSVLQKSGSSTLIFDNAANGFSSVTTSGGVIVFSDPGQLGNGMITFTDDAGLRAHADGKTLANGIIIDPTITATVDTQDNTLTLSGAITGATGTLEKIGSGTLIVNNAASNYGYTKVTAGTLEVATIEGLGTLGTTLVTTSTLLDFNRVDGGTNTYGGQITGDGAVNVRGNYLSLTNANNDYTGSTTVDGVSLFITHAQHGTNAGSVGIGDITLNGSTSHLQTLLAESGTLVQDITGTGYVEVTNPDGIILMLSGENNSYSGIRIHSGSVEIGSAKALGSGMASLMGNGATLISNRVQTIANTIRVNDSVTDAKLHVTEHLTLNPTGSNAILVRPGASLILDADGANILADRQVRTEEATNTEPAGVITKTGSGTFQISLGSKGHWGTMTVEEGAFRVVNGQAFGTSSALLNVLNDGALEGNGVLIGDMAVVSGGIDPTGKKLLSDGSEDDGSKYDTLTLEYATTFLEGFTLLYDALAPNTTGDPDATTNDLLKIVGDTHLDVGAIDVRTSAGTLANGRYLVVAATETITDGPGDALTDEILNNVITLTLDGNAYDNRSPRGNFHLELADYNNVTQSQIWLDASLNSLQMDWTAGSGAWNVNDDNWNSVQYTGTPPNEVRETAFKNGDFVYFSTPTAITVTLNEKVTVSGMDVGHGSDSVIGDGNVTISGTGGITSDRSSAFGKYADTTDPQGFGTSGMLYKVGDGKLAFMNTGENLFSEGINLSRGTLGFSRAGQLGVGTGKVLVFAGDSTLQADATTDLETDLHVSNGVYAKLLVDTDANGDALAMFVKSEISSATDDTYLNKTGAGIVQIETDSPDFAGGTFVHEGTWRVVDGATYGNAEMVLLVGFDVVETTTLAGGGTLVGRTFSFGEMSTVSQSIVSPDADTLTADRLTVAEDKKFGTITLQGDGSGTVILASAVQQDGNRNGFHFDYDVNAPNITGTATTNDLLVLTGMQNVYLQGGTVNFRNGTDGLRSGGYLVIDSNVSITDEYGDAFGENVVLDGINNTDGVLRAQLNGQDLQPENPRWHLEFRLRDGQATDSQLWLDAVRNTLMVAWQGGVDKVWTTDNSWESAQFVGAEMRDNTFNNGDFVLFGDLNDQDGYDVVLNEQVVVSGMDVGTAGTITLGGTGGIRGIKANGAGENYIEGKYANSTTDPQRFDTTGMFHKCGDGTFTFANTGTNLFEQGIELLDGTLSYNNADQLTVGADKAITFKADAVLRADATAELDTAVVVDVDATGMLQTDAFMLLQKNISGDGNITKTGSGTLQLAGTPTQNSSIGGHLAVQSGILRVVGGTTVTAATADVAASLHGGGTVNGTDITVTGQLSPDTATLTVTNTVVDDADKFGTLTLDATNITLDGFTFHYDLGTPVADTSVTTQTGDLLETRGATLLVGGTVDFHGTFQTGKYLIVQSDAAIDTGGKPLDGITDTTGVLDARYEGGVLQNDTVRGRYVFEFARGDSEIWLGIAHNSLTMVNVADGFESLQGGDAVKARSIMDGDAVILANNTEISYIFEANDRQLAHFEVGGSGDVEISGTGGLLTADDLAATEGQYVTGTGTPPVSVTGKLVKTDTGTLRFANTGINVFMQGADIDAGTIDIRTNLNAAYLNVGDSARGVTATLTGTGSISTFRGTVIASGSTLRPEGLSRDYTQMPAANFLTIGGDLTFESGSVYSVAMTQYDDGVSEKFVPVSDCAVVNGGTVNIVSGALLDIEFDYWNNTIAEEDLNSRDSDYFTIIDAAGGTVGDEAAKFTVGDHNLPIGVILGQGWNGGEYQLWFENDPGKNFETLCKRHNRREIGKVLDQHVRERDPLGGLIRHLSDGFTDKEICKLLDQLTGDLRENSIMTALEQPWRRPFHRLDRNRFFESSCDPCAAVCGTENTGIKTGGRQLWGETFGRYDDVDSDGNAHGYTVNRWGVAVGADRKISSRALVGCSFDYSAPILRQATGRTDVDNYGFGGYGLVRLNDRYDLKFYAGYSHQSYEIERNVYIPATRRYDASSERFRNTPDGDTVATSLELSRTFKVNRRFSFAPLVAVDYEKAWMDGYRESGGITALVYDRGSAERFMMRVGLTVDYKLRKNLELDARIQYGGQLNNREYASGNTRFAGSTLDNQVRGDIHGVAIGRDYLNLGVGAQWKPDTNRHLSLFVDYDLDLYKRATMHVGQFGVTTRW